MEHASLIQQLAFNRNTFESLLHVSSQSEITWKLAENKWCLLEIACHLFDEEREDFRARLKHTLENPKEKLPSIDPAGWVTARNYMAKDYKAVVNDFLKEREQSVQWLRALQSPDWKSAHHHHKFGTMSAEMFLANWIAHDYLHIRQVLGVKYAYLRKSAAEVSLAYAGEW